MAAMMRVGLGYDVHRFGEGDSVTLCGVKIPYHQALVAHSDGDVALHALCDALLGAVALGDIGAHFPDTDPKWQGVDSRELLRQVVALLSGAGWCLHNADLMVIAEAPRLRPHVDIMRELVASDCGVDIGAISIKATTNERIGFVGRGEGIAAQAVVSVGRVEGR